MRLKDEVRQKLLGYLVEGYCDKFSELLEEISKMYKQIDGYFDTSSALAEYMRIYKYSFEIGHNIVRCMDKSEITFRVEVLAYISAELQGHELYDELEEAREYEGDMAKDDYEIIYRTDNAEEFIKVLGLLENATKVYWIPSCYVSSSLSTEDIIKVLGGNKIDKNGYIVRLDNRINNGYVYVVLRAESKRTGIEIYAYTTMLEGQMFLGEIKKKIQEIEKEYPTVKKKYTLEIIPEALY